MNAQANMIITQLMNYFHNMKEITLNIEISEDIESTEDEIISIKLDITDYCEAHLRKI